MFKSVQNADSFAAPEPLAGSGSFDQCNGCRICVNQCDFLKQYGNPGEIAQRCANDSLQWMKPAFSCSMCGLCAALCPRGLEPSSLFLDLRRTLVEKGAVDFSIFKRLLDYERRGSSKRYSWYHLPEGCTTVFFPGCSMTGTRPGTTWKAYAYLQSVDPAAGMVLDCCTSPSHGLGRQKYFEKMFLNMTSFLLKHGIKKVIVACPSCHKIFRDYGGALEVKTIYEIMASEGIGFSRQVSGNITLHDPCAARFQGKVHAAVRTIATTAGLEIKEMAHNRDTTYCCGQGGAAGCLKPEFAGAWRGRRLDETGNNPMGTYCAACAGALSTRNPLKGARAFHILDFVFDPAAALSGRSRGARSPLTYLNRLQLKNRLRKIPAAISSERPEIR